MTKSKLSLEPTHGISQSVDKVCNIFAKYTHTHTHTEPQIIETKDNDLNNNVICFTLQYIYIEALKPK